MSANIDQSAAKEVLLAAGWTHERDRVYANQTVGVYTRPDPNHPLRTRMILLYQDRIRPLGSSAIYGLATDPVDTLLMGNGINPAELSPATVESIEVVVGKVFAGVLA